MTDEAEPDGSEPRTASPVAVTDTKGTDDVVLLGAESADGKSVGVLRLREGQVEIGRVQPLEEGKPIVGEIVKLTPRADAPRVCDVEVQYTPASTSKARSARAELAPNRARTGPPQVATDEYRRNWDAIWPGKKKPSQPS